MNMFSTQICMYIFILLIVVSLLLSFIIKESPMILSEESKAS